MTRTALFAIAAALAFSTANAIADTQRFVCNHETCSDQKPIGPWPKDSSKRTFVWTCVHMASGTISLTCIPPRDNIINVFCGPVYEESPHALACRCESTALKTKYVGFEVDCR